MAILILIATILLPPLGVAAKHGLEGLSKVTALEGGPHGVTSNCVNPGYVRTPLVERQIADQAAVHGISESEVVQKVLLTESAIKRLLEPEESPHSHSTRSATSRAAGLDDRSPRSSRKIASASRRSVGTGSAPRARAITANCR